MIVVDFTTLWLYFVRSGDIVLNNPAGTVWYAGLLGYAWPRYVGAFSDTTPTTAYRFLFNATLAYPSSGPTDHWIGFPLRCLSTALEG